MPPTHAPAATFRRQRLRAGPRGLTLRTSRGWNHNTHYHRLVMNSVPVGAARALDVGCGDGDLLADLSPVVGDLVGIDVDAPTLERAASTAPAATLINGDFLTYPFEPASFDLVAAIASMHHMDLEAGLRRMAELLRPGGIAVVVG